MTPDLSDVYDRWGAGVEGRCQQMGWKNKTKQKYRQMLYSNIGPLTKTRCKSSEIYNIQITAERVGVQR